jgi:hypothetical protein
VSRWDLPERLFKIEAGLRELAARGGTPSREELEKWHGALYGAVDACNKVLIGELEAACDAIRTASMALEVLMRALHDQALTAIERRRELEVADQLLDEVEEGVRRVTGRPCRWGKQLGEARLRHTLLVNDVAACVHVLAQHLLERGPERMEGRCAVARGARREAVEVCREWDEAVSALYGREVYEYADYMALRGFAVDGRVQLRVGSAAGHLAEIDLEEGVVRYYDTDEPVNRVMGKLMARYAGATCKLSRDEDAGVSKPSLVCKVGDPKRAARVLALATSMDVRIRRHAYNILSEMERSCIERRLAKYLASAGSVARGKR